MCVSLRHSGEGFRFLSHLSLTSRQEIMHLQQFKVHKCLLLVDLMVYFGCLGLPVQVPMDSCYHPEALP